MSEFFGMFAMVVNFLNDWKIFGNISVWHILLVTLVSTTIIRLLKGAKAK